MPDLVPLRPLVKRPSRWGRWVRAIGFAVQLTLAVGYVLYAIHYCAMTMWLRSALAEMDRDHPGWRLADIETARDVVGDNENSAIRITELDGLLPDHWLDEDLESQVESLPPQTQLNPDQFARVRKALDQVRPALEIARGLADLPKGRYPIVYQIDRPDKLAPYSRAMRKTVQLLRFDAAAEMQSGDFGGAARSVRGSLNAARSFGDEPGNLPQLVRIAGVAIASKSVSRLLAQGDPDEKDLEILQKEFGREERYPYWPLAWRGERALQQIPLQAMVSGDLIPLDTEPGEAPPTWFERAAAPFFFQDRARCWGPDLFTYYSRLEQTDELPTHLRQPILDKMAKEVYRETNPLLLGFPALAKIGQACSRIQTALRCEATALAAERYRRAHGVWPQSLDLLTPDLMASVPDDPFTGGPLLYHRLADGVVIYSVGLDGKDDGGNVDVVNVSEPGTDVGIRLWDVAKRRQPPAAPPNRP